MIFKLLIFIIKSDTQQGIYYNHKKNTVRTEKVNSVFSFIAQMTGVLGKKETRQNNDELDLSGLVELRGVEPRSGEGIDCVFYMFIGNYL